MFNKMPSVSIKKGKWKLTGKQKIFVNDKGFPSRREEQLLLWKDNLVNMGENSK